MSAYVVKGIHRNHLVYATDHLYGICQQELLKLLAWQVAADKGTVDVGKNYKYLFQHLPAEKEKEFTVLLDFSDQKKITKSLLATMHFSTKRHKLSLSKPASTMTKKPQRRYLSMLRRIEIVSETLANETNLWFIIVIG